MSTKKSGAPKDSVTIGTSAAHRSSPTKREVIVEAAKRVFLREGFSRASVDEIAAEGGVSKQTIYNHFGDKERLFFAVIESVQGGPSAEQEKALDALFDADAEPRVALQKLGQKLLAMMFKQELSALRRLMISEVAHYPQLRLAWARGGPLGLMIRLTGYLARETERGRLDIQKPERAARQFVALLGSEAHDLSVYGSIPLSPSQIDAIVDENLEMFMRAYGPRPSPLPKGQRKRAATRR